MATYVLPQVLVFQDFTIQPAAAANPLSAHISGGHAKLVRYSDENEREFGNLGFYDNGMDSAFSWPERPAGAVIDASYTKLYIKDALLMYFYDPSTSGSTITVVSGYRNRVVSSSVNFVANGEFPRDLSLGNRDVKIGDVVRVRGVADGTGATADVLTLWTYVRGFVANVVASTIAAPIAASSNEGAQSASSTATRTTGVANSITITPSGTYDGLPSGVISEVYTLTVIDGSINGDLTTARFRVTTASGTDNQSSLALSGATAVGTRGLLVTFGSTPTGGTAAISAAAGVSDVDILAGQVFTMTVNQLFDVPASTSCATYVSNSDTNYIVTVTKGGAWGDYPEISVATTDGVDQSGPSVIANNTCLPIGTRGVSFKLASTAGLRKGDRFYVQANGTSEGEIQTIVLGHNLDQTFGGTEEVGVDLYIRKPLLEVTANRTGMAPLTNWEQSDIEITVKSGIVAYDAELGTTTALDVYSSEDAGYGELYVECRAWLPDLAGKVNSIADVGNIDDISGSLTPDNPLKWGVFKALSNSNGTPVLYTAVNDPNDVDYWDEVLEVLLSRDDTYNLVPLTNDVTVLGLFQAHVNSCASPSEGLWRVLWANLHGIPETPIVAAGSTVPNHTEATSTDGEVVLARFEADSTTTAVDYTICYVPAGNAGFEENGVRPGDIVRALYTGDGFGNYTYSEFVVDEVQSEDQLRVKTGPAVEQLVPSKIEVWRTLSASEEAVEIAKTAGAYGDRRVRATWPDRIESSGTVQVGYFLNCALAGLASAVLPQQGLTNVEITGFSSTQRTNDKFNKPQRDILAFAGVWVVQQGAEGQIYTRHAVTTGDYADINQREEMLTRNVDSISYRFKDYFAPFIGVTNVTPTMSDIILGGMDKLIRALRIERTTPQLGGQLITATVDRFFISEVFKDRYVAYITLEVPYALNNIELHLVV
jgi:hypothetical protein